MQSVVSQDAAPNEGDVGAVESRLLIATLPLGLKSMVVMARFPGSCALIM